MNKPEETDPAKDTEPAGTQQNEPVESEPTEPEDPDDPIGDHVVNEGM